MTIGIPPNIFSAIFALSLSDELKESIVTKPSSLISKELDSGTLDLAIIPSLDLIKHNHFFVSKKMAISFDGNLSNSYLYFKPAINDFKSIHLAGDVSSNEAILLKILFKERYNSSVEVILESKEIALDDNNYLICGSENFEDKFFNKGISFSDEIAAMIDYPYTNYLLASKDESTVTDFMRELKELDKYIEDNLEGFLQKLKFGRKVNDFVNEEFNSIYYELTANELAGLNELLRLPYFHGIAKDIVEVKLV